MKTPVKILVACSALALAACDSDNNNGGGGPVPEFATVQVFHGSSDAPAVNVFVDGSEALSGVDYLRSSACTGVEAGTHEIRVDAILPGCNATVYSLIPRSLSALPITETELRLIAAAAIIGLSNSPKNG